MNVLYFKTSNSTFVLRDLEILRGRYPTRVFSINTTNPVTYFVSLIQLILYLLLFSWKADIFFIRFADWHTAIIAFFSRLFRKKLYVVIGGYDVAAIYQINYGLHIRKGRSRFARYAMKNATCLLPVSPNLIWYENRFIGDAPVMGGISYFVPKIKGKIQVISNGFDGDFWKRNPSIKKENSILTVAVVRDEKTFYLKGLDIFLKMASIFKEYQFICVGVSVEFLRQKTDSILPSNFVAVPATSSENLLQFYSKSRVFCLFSLSEGMPNVLCEAMLCECIPVGTDVTSIPYIIGNTGFIIKNKNEKEYEQRIREALSADPELGKSARNRILQEFSLERRRNNIINLLESEQ